MQAGLVARRALANASRAARRVVARAAMPPSRSFWLRLRLEPPFAEGPTPSLWPGRPAPLSLLEVLSTLQVAARDPRVDGIFLELAGAPAGLTQALSLRRALDGVRSAGKPVVGYAETLGEEELLVASGADRLFLPESGSVFLVGLRIEGLYLRGLLEEVGARPDVVRIGDYKTAAESFLRQEMSAQQREQLESLLEDRFEALVDGIARGRGLGPDAVRERIDEGPYAAPAALEAGLVDGCLYRDEVEERLEELMPVPPPERSGPRRVRFVEAPVYHSLHAADPGWRPLLGELPHIAYVVAHGAIRRGSGLRGVASDTYRVLLERLRTDPHVRGVVVRVSSPGGDGLASDLLHRGLSRLREEKPVVVSMGEVAASGGYYLAAGADTVLAESATVTGSIGVVGGKLDLSGLYERFGVSRDGVERGARAGMLSEARPFTTAERKAVREEMRAVYETFLNRVASGRSLSREAVERVAGGRVWSGAKARHLGLVDRLGGPLEALAEARRRAGLLPEERMILDVHPRTPRLGSLGALAGLLVRLRSGS
jgi:protease-4